MALNVKAIFIPPYLAAIEPQRKSYLDSVLEVQSSGVNSELLQQQKHEQGDHSLRTKEREPQEVKKQLNLL
jgi:hypothetical protein